MMIPNNFLCTENLEKILDTILEEICMPAFGNSCTNVIGGHFTQQCAITMTLSHTGCLPHRKTQQIDMYRPIRCSSLKLQHEEHLIIYILLG
jgi:hypothetical protein